MPSRFDRRILPADLVALAVRLNQDERRPRGELQQRSAKAHAALADLQHPPTTDHGRVLFWLGELPDVDSDQAGRQVRSGFALIGLILTLAGLLSGIGLASAVFYYDGTQPVNIVAGLGVFVLLQTVLLLLAVVAALPRGWVMKVPLAEGVQEALRLASPGRLGLLASRLLPQEMREGLAMALGRAGAHQRVFGRVQLWTILQWSQLYAFALNIAAAATFVYLVFFTDLAFGWATTLKIEPAQFHRIVHTVALPWWWLHEAVPSLELVERSRFYRGTAFNPELRGAWWPFMLAAMLVYGLLPRLIALLIAHQQLGLATRRALVLLPGVQGVLRSLDEGQSERSNGDDTAASNGPAVDLTLGDAPIVIDWSRAAGSAARASRLLNRSVERVYPVGGSRTIAEDEAQLAELGTTTTVSTAQGTAGSGVAVLVKLWEPPVIEFTDYLKQLRSAVGEGLAIIVVPVASEPGGAVVSADPELASQWRRRVSAVSDPWLAVGDVVGLEPEEATDE